MQRALLNFDHAGKGSYAIHFLEADCRTLIGNQTRRFTLANRDTLRAFVLRCNPECLADFDRSLDTWHRGSIFVNLSAEQYSRLY